MPRIQSFLSFVTLSVLLGATSAAIGPVADLVITNEVVAPDGFSREAILAGGSTIGPLIVGTKGDTFQLNVVNNLDVPDQSMLQSTSIHWHGFLFENTAWADGPAFVTQCPIVKGDSFLYEFTVPDQAGTFWYHSHLSTQYCDGLRGAIVVYDPNDPHASLYDVDDESTVITLADWYHAKAKTIVIGNPVTTLINGLGRWSQGTATDLAVVQVEAGKRYRMRVANIACDPAYTFHIDDHLMTVIEADGVSHEAIQVDSFKIYAGQRYSFVLNANQPVGNYWIRANPNLGVQGFTNGINSAILRYVGAPDEEPPVSTFAPTNLLSEAALVPLENPGAPGNPTPGDVDVAINLAFGFQAGRFTVNGVSYDSPTVPVLLQILSGAQTADNLLPEGAVYPLPPNAVVELSMPGGLLGIEHPMHLHGHAFDVVRSAGSSTYNFVNPPRRDVVSIGSAGDNVTIRFRTDNAGPWFLHCHIDWHFETGFAVVFAERTDEWATSIIPPPAWDQLCPIYDSTPETDL
ncbi:laccase, multicopper oxidase, benzenediol:oxygen oxidorectuctase [Paramarasmius palmivorus]|uniref:Laccase, multicopper oxidase, benzenediol:oxygen oxidorectuctase n=1 Tax=Paramarasmius palmivorus TaxID=297713 RepID=A0AAW0BVA0_9AGAR